MARRVLRLGSMGFPVYFAAVGPEDTKDIKIMTIADLPIYEPAPKKYVYQFVPSERNVLQKGIGSVRRFFAGYQESMKNFSEKVSYKWEVSKAHTLGLIDYIQNDPNVLARAGVITVAGLGGIVAGYRGGRMKKVAYSSIAIVSAASLCYPKQAANVTYSAYDGVVSQSCKLWKFLTAPPSVSPPEPVKETAVKEEKAPAQKSNGKNVVVNLTKTDSAKIKPVEKDFGQSSEEDKDLYTTRG
ncbi:MICOS complex subunit MIC27 [Octopus bimaculoides]|uniref:MICOS complex subunit n=1 Tax=Octopus bimaculoides TaxID=37653 RepID=A0A0L8GU78_OCTBM|nr:MICOS complex subunit MIC27 [Octopus bimaculoides]|eukprot:XP_014777968.1 PREDICTED: MICOS complex subunit MIC27-like [Octopus bimaculoides]